MEVYPGVGRSGWRIRREGRRSSAASREADGINRAGKNLPAARLKTLEAAKRALRRIFGREAK